ncbi:hypothetical protein [Microvirga sp. 2TAF3]|uniref:hypothetical protein n=1 Tax=Microvirga sp. 2TAF3 TaxID=3233014 RepID=UPI003F945B3B
MYEQIKEKVEAVAAGETSAEEVTGSTTVRLAVGLILNRLQDTNPTLSDPIDAWERLDEIQRAAVQDLRPIYGDRRS